MSVSKRSTRAIVIGASITGSMLAKILSSRFDEVVLIDRDIFPDDVEMRTTVAQENHVHFLLQRGKMNMEKLYPGFLAALERAGAEKGDLSNDVKWFNGGAWKARWRTGIEAYYCSRTLIEFTLRSFARQLENVTLMDGLMVQEPIVDASQAVTGVRVTDQAGTARDIHADLVIDASGRGTNVAAWLEQLGHGAVETEQVTTRLGYVSRIYKRNTSLDQHWRALLITPRLPDDHRLVAIAPLEGGRFIVSAGGWFGAFPELEEDKFLAFLKALPVSDAFDIVSASEPLSGLKRFRMPGSLRRRYDRCRSWPKGFLVVGDALCSLNPIYSQGMSVAAMQVEALSDGIDAYLAGRLSAQQVFASLIAATERPWQQAKGADARVTAMPAAAVHGVKSRLRARYLKAFAGASAESRKITIAMLRISNLLAPESSLFQPAVALEVARCVVIAAVRRRLIGLSAIGAAVVQRRALLARAQPEVLLPALSSGKPERQ